MMRFHILSILLIVLTGLLIYGATLQYPYHWDDYRTIVDNPALADPFQLHDVFSFWPTRGFLFWTFSLNQLSGSSALSSCHLTNISIHLAAAIVLYLLIYRTLKVGTTEVINKYNSQREYAWTAAIAALLFVSHPIATGGVTYLIQRGVSLSGALGLISLLLYTYSRGLFFSEGRRFISPRHLLLYGLSLIFLLLAMLTKEGAVVFPILIICWELIFGEKTLKHSVNNEMESPPAIVRSAGLQPCPEKAGLKSRTTSNLLVSHRRVSKQASLRPRFLYLLPLVSTIAIIPIISLTTVKGASLQDDILYRVNRPWLSSTMTFLDGGEGSYLASSWEYFLTQLKSLAIYLRLSFLPVRQNFYYHLMPRHSIFEGKTIFLLMGYLSLIVCGIKLIVRVNSKERTASTIPNVSDVPTVPIVSADSVVPAVSADSAVPIVSADSAASAVPFASPMARIPNPISQRMIGLGILWFFIALIPTSSFLILWPFLSEFHLYISLAGLSFFWAGVILLLPGLKQIRLFRSVLLLVIFAFALLAIRRNAVYSSSISLWKDTVKNSPRLAPAYSNLSAAYIGQGEYRKAIEASKLAMDLNRKFNGYRNLRTAYRAAGAWEKANELIEEEIERFPDSYRGYFEKALTIIKEDPAGARKLLIKALEKHPPPEIKSGIERELSNVEEVP